MIGAVGCCLQPFSISDDDTFSGETDNAPILKIIQADGNAGSPRSQHQRQKLVCQRNSSPISRSLSHKQPLCQSFFKSGGAV